MMTAEVHQIQDWKTFLRAGKAVFTVRNTATGNRFTFRVNRHHDCQGRPTQTAGQDTWWVSVLSGPDNMRHYTYIGAIFGTTFRLTRGSKVNEEAQSFRVFAWLNLFLQSDRDLPPGIEIHHEGRCGRCGRTLTVPESIESGFGPECIQLIGR